MERRLSITAFANSCRSIQVEYISTGQGEFLIKNTNLNNNRKAYQKITYYKSCFASSRRPFKAKGSLFFVKSQNEFVVDNNFTTGIVSVKGGRDHKVKLLQGHIDVYVNKTQIKYEDSTFSLAMFDQLIRYKLKINKTFLIKPHDQYLIYAKTPSYFNYFSDHSYYSQQQQQQSLSAASSSTSVHSSYYFLTSSSSSEDNDVDDDDNNNNDDDVDDYKPKKQRRLTNSSMQEIQQPSSSQQPMLSPMERSRSAFLQQSVSEDTPSSPQQQQQQPVVPVISSNQQSHEQAIPQQSAVSQPPVSSSSKLSVPFSQEQQQQQQSSLPVLNLGEDFNTYLQSQASTVDPSFFTNLQFHILQPPEPNITVVDALVKLFKGLTEEEKNHFRARIS